SPRTLEMIRIRQTNELPLVVSKVQVIAPKATRNPFRYVHQGRPIDIPPKGRMGVNRYDGFVNQPDCPIPYLRFSISAHQFPQPTWNLPTQATNLLKKMSLHVDGQNSRRTAVRVCPLGNDQ